MAINAPRDLVRALRPAQWAKNLLLAVPLLVGHQYKDTEKLLALLVAFVSFSVCASAVYIVNDLIDVSSDQLHPVKRRRPFAAGLVTPRAGVAMVIALLTVGLLIAQLMLPTAFVIALLVYLALTTAYSFYFKSKMILDVILLAGLYTHRIIAGGMAVDVTPTMWLLAFSGFIFLSLAFAKRYAELSQLQGQESFAAGRGYRAGDLDLVRSIGPAGGYLAVLVFCLYINTPDVQLLYHRPVILWFIVPVLLYWITRIWFVAQRGALQEDPVLFTLTDRVSYIAGIVTLVVLFVAGAK